MSQTTFPNGQTLISSALTPDTCADIFQPILAQILGIDPTTAPQTAYSTVRIAWAQTGQPSWGITENVCIIRATAVDDPYSRVRDSEYQPNDPTSLTNAMGFTQVWNIHHELNGPNSYDNARLILSAMTLSWVHDLLAAQNLYMIVAPDRPTYVPYVFEGQWWKRTDLNIKFNEQVFESITVSSAAGVDVTIITDAGETDEFTIGTT